MNRRRVIGQLEQWGLTINRGNSEKTLSVTSSKLIDKNGKPMGVRLKGGMFEKGFDGYEFEPEVKEESHSAYDRTDSRNERAQLDKEHLATGIEIKEAYHQERYGDSGTARLLVSDKKVKQELEVAKPAPAETYITSFRPGF